MFPFHFKILDTSCDVLILLNQKNIYFSILMSTNGVENTKSFAHN